MKRLRILIMVMTALFATAAVTNAERIEAELTGFEEVPVVSTFASGDFEARISRDEQSIDFLLRYRGLQGTVTQGHVHVAQLSVNGSIVFFLCQTAANPDPTNLSDQCPAGKETEAVVTGTITAANVIAGSMAPQQLTAGDLAEVIRAIRADAAYVNVHTDLSPGGEIRGQIEDKDNNDKKDKRDRDDKGNKGRHH
jgi:hypothetical protein